MGRTRPKPGEPIIVKKYANRRLYDTWRSAYVTLADLNEMVKENIDFVVQDAKTGEDLTRSVLTQIVADQETKEGENLLPTSFLRRLISLYGENMHAIVPGYLEHSLEFLLDNQKQMLDQMDKQFAAQQERMEAMGGMFAGPKVFQEMNRKNMEIFQNTMKAFTPFPVSSEDEKKDK
jgi:polyhydroxyalkanoate synthesis repressor PhaR